MENLTTTGTTVVLTTHYIDEADHLANRLILLAGGQVVADTTPEGLRPRAGRSTIRYRLPDDAPLATCRPRSPVTSTRTAGRWSSAPTTPPGRCAHLLGWADRHHLDLSRTRGRPAQPGRRLPGGHRRAAARKEGSR